MVMINLLEKRFVLEFLGKLEIIQKFYMKTVSY